MNREKVTNGCKGLCCVAFYFPYTLEELKARQEDPKDAGVTDGDMIADMLIPLTVEEADARLIRFGSPSEGAREENEGHYFTCRHFDEENMLCTVYEIRPDMCSRYPYGRTCEHGCSHRGKAAE